MEERSKKETETNLATELTGLNRTLCRVAGSDLKILSECPHEISRHARIGAIIISTAILASVSMFFAIQTVSQSTLTGLVAGSVWGLAIFILDSYIIASYKKNENKWKEFKIVIPRLVLALVLGCSISIPLELKVFSNEIFEEIKIIRQEKEIENQAKANEIYLKQLAPINQQKEITEKTLKELIKPLIQKDSIIQSKKNLITLELAGKGPSGQKGRGIVVINLENEVIALETQKKTLENSNSYLIDKYQNDIAKNDSIISNIPKPNPDKIGQLYGISVQLDAMKRLTSKNTYVLLAYWIFFLLILGIETAPIFVKFFTPKGSYDEIFAMNEYITFLKQQKRKSDLHELINAEIDTIRSINERKKIAQDNINGRMMTEIASAQGEIAEKAIRLWKEKQLRKVDDNIDDFINTNEPQFNTETEIGDL